MYHRVSEGHEHAMEIVDLQQRVTAMEQIQLPNGPIYDQEDFMTSNKGLQFWSNKWHRTKDPNLIWMKNLGMSLMD
jgi:hypothetical protein